MRLFYAAGVAVAGVCLAPGAFAFDCSKAATDTEKTICANPDLKVDDDAMSAAYTALLPTLDAAQQKLAKANQLSWIQKRDNYCGGGPDSAEKTKCMVDMTKARAGVLWGKPAAGPGSPAPLKPVFTARAQTKTKCSTDLVVMKFDPASGAAATAFNDAVDKMLAGMEKDNGDRDPSVDPPYDCDYSVSGSLNYASDAVVNEDLAFDMYGGGAHPMSGETAVTVDLTSQKLLSYADVFGASADTKKKLVDACTADLVNVKKERFAQAQKDDPNSGNSYPDPAEDVKQYAEAIADGVTDFSHWMIKADHVDVYFGPYEVGSYAEGPYSCTLPNSLLNTLAGARGWVVK